MTSISQRYVVTFNGSKEWLVPTDAIKTIDDQPFLKLCPKYARGMKTSILKDCSFDLAKSQGYKVLLELRAKASTSAEDAKAKGLFDDPVSHEPTPLKKRRVGRDQQSAERAGFVEIVVPGEEGHHPVKVCRNAHPTDALVVPLEQATLDVLFKFITASSATPESDDDDTTPLPQGVFKMGLGRLARKVDDPATGKSRHQFFKSKDDLPVESCD